jgi:hypothetical protein
MIFNFVDLKILISFNFNISGENKSLNHKNQEILKVSILYFGDFKKGLFMKLYFLSFANFEN